MVGQVGQWDRWWDSGWDTLFRLRYQGFLEMSHCPTTFYYSQEGDPCRRFLPKISTRRVVSWGKVFFGGTGGTGQESLIDKPKKDVPPTVPLSHREARQGEGEAGREWSLKWAETFTSKAVRWLAENFPECGGAAALDPHRAEIDAAARAEDAGAYERALRKFAKAGKCEALRLRREKEEAA